LARKFRLASFSALTFVHVDWTRTQGKMETHALGVGLCLSRAGEQEWDTVIVEKESGRLSPVFKTLRHPLQFGMKRAFQTHDRWQRNCDEMLARNNLLHPSAYWAGIVVSVARSCWCHWASGTLPRRREVAERGVAYSAASLARQAVKTWTLVLNFAPRGCRGGRRGFAASPRRHGCTTSHRVNVSKSSHVGWARHSHRTPDVWLMSL